MKFAFFYFRVICITRPVRSNVQVNSTISIILSYNEEKPVVSTDTFNFVVSCITIRLISFMITLHCGV